MFWYRTMLLNLRNGPRSLQVRVLAGRNVVIGLTGDSIEHVIAHVRHRQRGSQRQRLLHGHVPLMRLLRFRVPCRRRYSRRAERIGYLRETPSPTSASIAR